MLLEISHQTDLTYDEMISESVVELRVAPRQEMYQHRLSFDLAIGPPTGVSSYFDWLDNLVYAFTINGFHDQIRIIAKSVVEVDRPAVDLASLTDTWPVEAVGDYTMIDYLRFGRAVPKEPQLEPLVKDLYPTPGMPLGEMAQRMLDLINNRFLYEPGVTDATSTLQDLLTHEKGVCQDFTHLFIGLARSLGIPARYVSGLVHPEQENFRGAYQTHAWAELFFPSTGWIGFDPTNRCVVGSNFVTIALGRDYRDVPPNKGVYRGKATEAIEVGVTSRALDDVPPELAADRVQPLGIPVYPGWGQQQRMTAGAADHARQQQQQQ